ncbi:NAD(P)-binding protein [Coniophora puteana RWD-64-598 SS2]|uniref:NAD(P)-binding protein n=1 Tax=Coniophora puteana (strain RWD-64-598) TaxID=741705 RepID=A0A5M3M8M2_CONPW|nr:NAD(P)-binding protein [Coniophora puteana RWD-64-598 SS2]EIW75588.1 NAD(P)-binding protein [Coniophora puteana RWD-64-598 SS2]
MVFPRQRFNPENDLPSLSGKVILVTGGNAGIGYGAAKHLARRGAKVYMGARSEDKAKAAIDAFKQEAKEGAGEIVHLKLDLSDPRDAKKAAEDFLQKEQRLDALINNAALQIEKYAKSVDGIQDLAMVNYVSPFVFTRTLLPLLKKTAAEPGSDVRIVIVASEAHRKVKGEPNFKSAEDFNEECKNYMFPSFGRYCFTKLMDTLWFKELQRRLSSDPEPGASSILVIGVDPGMVNTFSGKPPLKPFRHVVDALVYPWFVSADEGAYNPVFAAVSPEITAENRDEWKGAYLLPVAKKADVTDVAADEGRGRELWETTEKFLEEKGIGK